MITAESSAVIQRTPQEILDFVMDVASYRRADHKIGRVWSVRREDNNVIASFVGQLRGLPVPTTQRMHLTPGKRIDVSIVPNWQRRMLGFHASFECQPVLGGTEVTPIHLRLKRPYKAFGAVPPQVVANRYTRRGSAHEGDPGKERTPVKTRTRPRRLPLYSVRLTFSTAQSRDTSAYPAIANVVGIIASTPYITLSIVLSLPHKAVEARTPQFVLRTIISAARVHWHQQVRTATPQSAGWAIRGLFRLADGGGRSAGWLARRQRGLGPQLRRKRRTAGQADGDRVSQPGRGRVACATGR